MFLKYLDSRDVYTTEVFEWDQIHCFHEDNGSYVLAIFYWVFQDMLSLA